MASHFWRRATSFGREETHFWRVASHSGRVASHCARVASHFWWKATRICGRASWLALRGRNFSGSGSWLVLLRSSWKTLSGGLFCEGFSGLSSSLNGETMGGNESGRGSFLGVGSVDL